MFGRFTPQPSRSQRLQARSRRMASMARTVHARQAVMGGETSGVAIEKDEPARSEAYRRLVAAMPCCSCGCAAPNQAAHANEGKGMGMKSDDRTCFSLCQQCHGRFDQGAMFNRENRRLMERLWGARTREAILSAGAWPHNLPEWTE